MSDGIIERERQRSVWRRHRSSIHLTDPFDPNFGRGGLATRVEQVSLRVLILPSDPEAELVTFSEDFWSQFMEDLQDPISGTAAVWGKSERPTWEAACRVDDWNGIWREVLAVHRSGAVESIVRSKVMWERGDDRVFGLVGIVGYVWNTLMVWQEFSAQLNGDFPWEVSVALIGTENSQLGGLARGWRDPYDPIASQLRCTEPGLLFRREVHEQLDGNGIQHLAFEIGDQVENAWGSRHRRYLIWDGELTNEFDASKWQ